MKILFLDCFSGISGDMTVGALCDLGVKPSALEWELSKLDLGDFHMHFERKKRQNVEGVRFSIHEGATHTHDQDEPEEHGHVHGPGCGHEHGHHEHEHSHDEEPEHEHADHHHGHAHEEHEHHEHEHHHHHGGTHAHHDHGPHEHGHATSRSFGQIRDLIKNSDLSAFVKTRSVSIFRRIAVAEGKIHGQPPEEVTFHEVGALDSIADIICACAGIEQLKIDRIAVSNLSEGRGWITCAHGRFPIPSMATLEILSGIPLEQIDEPYEFITPTGAAIVAEFGESFGVMPPLRTLKVGYGVGSRNMPNRPNVLRAVLGETAIDAPSYETDTITRIETNIDDLSPEITGSAIDKLFGAGALDVFLTSIQMKKNRPGVQLTVLCDETAATAISDIIFRETTSFGVRMDRVQRLKLERRFEKVRTEFGEVTVKLGLRAGEVIQVSPEFETCRAISEKSGQALRAVYEAAVRAYGK